MNKSRKEYPILKKISNFCPPYLPRILRHYNSSSNRKRRIGSSEIKIQGETNTRGKEVHFLRVNATKYIYIYLYTGRADPVFISRNRSAARIYLYVTRFPLVSDYDTVATGG